MDRRLVDGRKFPYFVVEDEYIDRGHAAKMGPAGWMIFCVILRHAHKDGSSPPSVTDMMAATGLARATVVSACMRLRRLEYVGYELRKGGRGGRVGVYTIADLVSVPGGSIIEPPAGGQRGSEIEPPVVQKLNHGGSKFEPRVVQKLNRSCAKIEPQTVVPPITPSCREEQPKQQQQERTADAAAASAAPSAEQADIARQARALLVLEGVASDVAAQLVETRGDEAYDAIKGLIRRANEDKPRNRAAWLVAALRNGYVVPEPVRSPAPEDRRAKVLAEHATHSQRQHQELQDLLRREREARDRLATLGEEERAELLAAARAACPMAKGDLATSPVLMGWAIANMEGVCCRG